MSLSFTQLYQNPKAEVRDKDKHTHTNFSMGLYRLCGQQARGLPACFHPTPDPPYFPPRPL